jgi:hypothetical protein
MVKGCWQDLKGLKNRKRIWKDVTEVARRIERYRGEGGVVDEEKQELDNTMTGLLHYI